MSTKTFTRKFITYEMPGSFFPETSTEEVQSFDVPKSVPADCFAFSFHTTEYAKVDGKEFEGKTTSEKSRYIIGEKVSYKDIPNDDKHRILRSNIECNSPTKTGVRTHLGNWQTFDTNTVVIDPSEVKFSKPLIYKNIKKP